MAKDEKKPSATEKGKAKASEVSDLDGDRKKGKTVTDKDGKPVVDGKQVDGLAEGKSLTYPTTRLQY